MTVGKVENWAWESAFSFSITKPSVARTGVELWQFRDCDNVVRILSERSEITESEEVLEGQAPFIPITLVRGEGAQKETVC